MSDLVLLGELCFWVALLMTLWAAGASFYGGVTGGAPLVESGRRAVYVSCILLALAFVGLLAGLLGHDFSLRHAAAFTSLNLPAAYTVASIWAGAPGALLFWGVLLSGFSAFAIHARRTSELLAPYVASVLAGALTLLLIVLAFGGGPFGRLQWVPPDGFGLQPRLQHPLVLLYPPVLYAGYLATVVPFALASAALAQPIAAGESWGRVGRWTTAAWLLVTLGMLLGLWWSYLETGGGTSWVRSPLWNGSLLMWTVLTALLFGGRLALGDASPSRPAAVLLLALLPLSVLGVYGVHSDLAGSRIGFSAVWLALGALIAASLVLAGVVVTRRWPAQTGPDAISQATQARYTRPLAQLGFAVSLLAVVSATAFSRSTDALLATGDEVRVRDAFGREWVIASEGVSRYEALNHHVLALTLSLERDGERRGLITTELRQFVDSRGAPTYAPAVVAGTSGSLIQDVHARLLDVRGDTASVRIGFSPGARLTWAGVALLVLAGVLSLVQVAKSGRAVS